MSRPFIRYAITDRSHYGQTETVREKGLLLQTRHLAQSRIDYLQLREKDLSTQKLVCLARKMLDLLRDAATDNSYLAPSLLINSRPDVAAAAGAHGVHLTSGPGQLTPEQARSIFGRDRSLISISCHTLAEVERARDNDADLILFGPVFGKSIAATLAVPGTGIDSLADACRAAGTIPVLALGGVTLENTSSCIQAGAKGIAAIRLFQHFAE